MKTFLLICCLCCPSFAQSLVPPAAGKRITVEVSSDLQTWTRAMPHNSPRGFIRARTESNAFFENWINNADALTGEDVDLFSNGIRNPKCWGGSLDLTAFCITPQAGVLVSPRHVLFVTHYHPAVGATLQWVTQDNQTISRTLSAVVSLSDTAYVHPDITVGVIDSEIPSSISFVKVFGDNTLRDWAGYRVPVVIRDQFNRIHEADVQQVSPLGATTPTVWLQAPLSPLRLPRYKTVVSGDSGSPVCVVENSKPVLLMMLSQGGSGRGTFLAAYIDAINAAMQQLGGTEQLTIAAGLLAEPQMP